MADDRRGSKRAFISGVRVTYESANGQRVEAEAMDLSTGGLFLRTSTPLAVGKRITLEIQVLGEPSSWSALGRVVWVRPNAAPGMPSGMGIKLIDVDDAVVAAIDTLVETREPTSPGVGAGVKAEIAPIAPVVMAAPVVERDRTLMGVGAADDERPAAKGSVRPAAGVRVPGPPPREASLEREASMAFDLVSNRPSSRPPPSPAMRPKEARGGASGRWVIILLLLVIAGIAAYGLIDGFLRPPGR